MKNNKPSLKKPILVTIAFGVAMIATGNSLPSVNMNADKAFNPITHQSPLSDDMLPSNRPLFIAPNKIEIINKGEQEVTLH